MSRQGGSGEFRTRRLAQHVATTMMCGRCRLVRPSSQVQWVEGRPLCAECRERRDIKEFQG